MSAPEDLAFELVTDEYGNIVVRLNHEVAVYTLEEQEMIRDGFHRLEAECDDLRELVRDMYVQFDSTIDWPDIERRMRELGVEI